MLISKLQRLCFEFTRYFQSCKWIIPMFRRDKLSVRSELWVHTFYVPIEALPLLQICVGVVLFFGSSISQTTNETEFEYWDIGCDMVEPFGVYCSKVAKPTYDIPTIPVDNIPENITLLEAHLSIDGSWLIKNHTMFHKFQKLENMRLVGPVVFAAEYDNEEMRTKLINQLFEPLSSLRVVALWYWNVSSTYNWIFPKGVTDILLIKCGLTQLDVSYNTNLRLLSIRHNNFTKMPTLSSPPPPLNYLTMSGNPEIEFTAHDIVDLCKLNAFGITTGFNKNLNETARYCECRRLKTYMSKTGIRETESFDCPHVTSSIDCTNYSVDEMLALRKEKCALPKPTTLSVAKTTTPSSEWNTTTILSKTTSITTIEITWWTEPPLYPEPGPETSFPPVTEPLDHSKRPPVVCEPCPGCIGVVIGWSFFMVILFLVVATIVTYTIVKRQLFFF